MKFIPLPFAVLGCSLFLFTIEANAASQTQIDRGEYLARIGDCTGCHTTEDGQSFAGGLGIDSPFGTIYSSNITPDKQTGIGNYSRDDFAAALREGSLPDGTHLYPAMPYTAYAKVTDEDIDALYAYFMEGVEPVDNEPEKTDLSFPFNQRWGIGLWDWMFATADTYEPNPDQSEQYNRGAYLVEGLGHCGSCHTPRGLFFQQKAYGAGDDHFLTGQTLGVWYAPNLRGGGEGDQGLQGWSEKDIANYLATGRNVHSGVVGEMISVVQHSLSHLKDEDLTSIAVYLKSLPRSTEAPSDDEAPSVQDKTDENKDTSATLASAKVDIDSGERLYLDNCNACHFTNGKGASWVFPALKGNSLVVAENPDGLLHVILAGAQMPSTPKAPAKLAMPGFGWRLSDKEVADLATFVRSGWGNDGDSVTADQVAEVRKGIPEKVLRDSAPNMVKE
ncbi:cytochrome c [Halomonas sp. PR-M31]|uniref:cytochrome c n=1 Tax=Halomonas sp. PR-M31 TaxID=1471202 RepID=UPI000AEE5FEA|nr:cytochrome c [Halomonas sp. PR-M31]